MVANEVGISSLNIMLVEDDPELLDMAQLWFMQCGHNVHVESNGKDALSALTRQEYAPDVIVSDVNMPLMDGVELAAEIKSIIPDLPIVLISGYDRECLNSDNLPNEGLFFLPKPFRLQELVQAVETAAYIRQESVMDQSAITYASGGAKSL